MVQPHPHAGATHKIIAREDGAFEVEVSLPMGAAPVTITGLSTRAEAEGWIARHREAIAAGAPDKHQAPSGPTEPK
jgi:hypothetical protein